MEPEYDRNFSDDEKDSIQLELKRLRAKHSKTKLVTPFNKDDLFQPKDVVIGPLAGGKASAIIEYDAKYSILKTKRSK
jgi:hypothetical protein